MEDDPHEILGVAFDANPDEVKDAYREMVKKHHPDVSDSPDAEERFLDIRRAYEEMAERAEKTEGKGDRTPNRTETESQKDGGFTETEEDVSPSRDVPPSGGEPESGFSSRSSSGSDSTFSSSRTSPRRPGGTKRHTRNNPGSGTENRGSTHHTDEGERVEGLRGGWEILRGVLNAEEDESWFVHRPRGGYYLNAEAGRTKTRHGFGSRSEAKEAYKSYMDSDSRKTRPSGHEQSGRGYHVTDKIDSRWRIIRSPRGFAVVSHGHPPTFLDGSGEEVFNPHWFEGTDEARDAHRRRTQRAKPGTKTWTRLLLAPFLFPFLAVLRVLRLLGSSESEEKYRPYISGTASTVLLFTLAFLTESLILAGFATVSLTLLSVWLLSPYEPPDD